MFDPARLVFIDETSTNTAMVRLRGRCPRGIRLTDHVPHGHWKTITFIAGLRRRAMVAPFVLDGPMNSTSFMAYLKRCLVPTLKRGDIVMMDSLPVHKAAGVREVIEAAGAKLRYLPKYSPDLNPIEMAFSKLKAHLRKAAERTIPHLSRRIGALDGHGVAVAPRRIAPASLDSADRIRSSAQGLSRCRAVFVIAGSPPKYRWPPDRPDTLILIKGCSFSADTTRALCKWLQRSELACNIDDTRTTGGSDGGASSLVLVATTREGFDGPKRRKYLRPLFIELTRSIGTRRRTLE